LRESGGFVNKRYIAAVLLCSLFAASAAQAAGVNLRWNNCASEGGVANQNFACNTNSGVSPLIASFVLAAPQVGVNAVEVIFDVSVSGGAVPPWWSFLNAGSCRPNSLVANPVLNPADLICQDWAQGQASGGLATYTIGSFGPSTARIVTVFAVNAVNAADLVVGSDYFVENLLLEHQKTVGVGACAGCSTPACVAIENIQLFVGSTAVVTLTQPANGVDSNFATWQGGVGVPPLPGGACPAVVPTRSSTWSAVKSLYR
jgi:hypothetical protein